MRLHHLPFVVLLWTILGFLSAASAQTDDADPRDIVILFDSSASMRADVDGTPKVDLARQAANDLLASLPRNRRAGLVTFGNGATTQCGNIETRVPLTRDRGRINRELAAIKPRGFTPLSSAIEQVAEEFGDAERPFEVVLFSDGGDQCFRDPCEIAKKLEEANAQFTAHVVVTGDPNEARLPPLECIASTSGGRLLMPDEVTELASVSDTVPIVPAEDSDVRVRLVAVGPGGNSGGEATVRWRITRTNTGETVYRGSGRAAGVAVELPPGTYDFFAQSTDGRSGEQRAQRIVDGADAEVRVPLTQTLDATVRVVPAGEAPVSSKILVEWTGPDRARDYVTVVQRGAREGAYLDYAYTANGNPLTLTMPNEPGEYEVRYVLGEPPTTLARTPITATATKATLDTVASVSAGDVFEVKWTGPNYEGDWVTIVKPDAREGTYTNYWYTRKGNPAQLTAPLEPGNYEVRYVSDRKVIARRPIEVTGVAATISGPRTAVAGTRHRISWTGPNGNRDWITVTKPSDRPRIYTEYAYTSKGSPQVLRMPLEPGEYEFRYVQEGRKVLARQPVTITRADAGLDAPRSARAGSDVAVAWKGPAQNGDWITIVEPSARDGQYTDYAYAREGNPVMLMVPVEPGTYEYRYVLDGKKVIARSPLVVTDVSAAIKVPRRVAAGASFEVGVDGPANPRDFVTIVKPDAANGRYTSYDYVRSGEALSLVAPKEPGNYEVRYVLRGKRVIARVPITVVASELPNLRALSPPVRDVR